MKKFFDTTPTNDTSGDALLKISADTSMKFARYIKFTDSNATSFIDLISKIKKITNMAHIKIQEVVKDFSSKLKNNDIDHVIMNKYYEETAQFFMKLSRWNFNFSMMLDNNYISPFRQFQDGIYQQSLNLFKEMEHIVYELNDSKKEIKAVKENYYQLCYNVEKGEERLNNL